MSNFCEIFSEYFDVITDDEPWVADEAFKLRYQVYCIEQGFEEASRFQDEREIDDFDYRSAHGIVRHSPSGVTAAAVRLVLPDRDDPETLFPVEKHCGEFSQLVLPLLKGVPRHAVAEISRLAVSKDFKRRLGESQSVAGVASDQEIYARHKHSGKRVIPHLVVGLFAALLRMSAEHNITHLYAVMDVSLLRLLNRFGISFIPIGGLIDYHGLRQPCFGGVDELLAGIWDKRHDIWQLMTADGSVWPAPENPVLKIAK